MKVKFQADNDLDRTIVRGVMRVRPVIDFRSQPLEGLDDLTVLHVAAQDSRILVSHDVSAMPAAFLHFRSTADQLSPGVLLVPQSSPLADNIERLILIWELTEAAEWMDRICYLPSLLDFRIP